MRICFRFSAATLFAIALAVARAHAASFGILDYGADASGRNRSTHAIQAAIDECNRAGGGEVLVPAGRFRTSALVLKSGVTMQFAVGSVLDAPTTYAEYTPFKSLIRATNAERVALRGPVVILGHGELFWDVVPNPTTWFKGRTERPSPLVQFKNCNDVTVDGITITNAPSWSISPWSSTNVTIRNVTILNDIYGPNTDGIDLCQCQKTVVSDCRIVTGDDAIVIKNKSDIASENVSRDIVVSRCDVTTPSYALKIGTESRVGIFENIVWQDCRTRAGKLAWGMHSPIAIESVDGAAIRNVRVSRIACEGARTPVFIRLGNRGAGQATSPPNAGSISDVLIEDIATTPVTGDREFCIQIHGLADAPVANVVLRNIRVASRGGVSLQHLKVGDVTELVVPEKEDRYPSVEMFGWLPAHGIFCRHARGVTFENIELRLDAADVRHAVVLDDTSNITLRSVRVLHPGIENCPAETLHRVTRSPGVRLNPRPAVIGTTPGWVLSTAE
jgi:hypothetical protein